MFKNILFASGIAIASVLSGCSTTGGSTSDQMVYFVAPTDNATVTSPFKVQFGVRNLDVKPALEDIENAKAGHHHLLINLDPIAEGQGVPFSDQHMHFGKAQTEAEIKLAPGRYKLTMQFANGAHVSYGKRLSQTITVLVK